MKNFRITKEIEEHANKFCFSWDETENKELFKTFKKF